MKGVCFVSKMVYKRVRIWTSGAILPVLSFPGTVLSSVNVARSM